MTDEEREKLINMALSKDESMMLLGLSLMLKHMNRAQLVRQFPVFVDWRPENYITYFRVESMSNYLLVKNTHCALHVVSSLVLFRDARNLGNIPEWQNTKVIYV